MLQIKIIKGPNEGKVFTLTSGEMGVGRSADSKIQLQEWHISGEHGRFSWGPGVYLYRDLFSTNGSILVRDGDVQPLDDNGSREVELLDGDELRLGDEQNPIVLGVQVKEDTEERSVLAIRRLTDLPTFGNAVERRPGYLSKLYQLGHKLASQLELDYVFKEAQEAIFSLLPQTSHFSIYLKEGERFVQIHGGVKNSKDSQEITLSRTLMKRVLKEKAGVLAVNATQEFSASQSIMAAKLLSTLCVPLWQGVEIFGIIQVDDRTAAGRFSEEDLELLTVAAGQIGMAIRNARLYCKLKVAQEELSKENRFLKNRERKAPHRILGESVLIKNLLVQIEKVKDTRVTVLIQGDTGTGKELVARAIHYTGNRSEHLFVAQNMTALPESILESELFGHKRGAFTGADGDKKGLFEIAHKGTLFLDEIGEITPALQAKLLRVLQEGEVRPVGDTRTRKVDVRVVSATNRDLEKEVAEGRFRQDLYFRLNVFPINVPPLRERKEDALLLMRHFLDRFGKELGKPVAGISSKAQDLLASYAWPGNIRELENEAQRLVIQLDGNDIVLPEHLSYRIGQAEVPPEMGLKSGATLKEMVEEVERRILTEALERHGGNKSRTAEALGITREGLHKKLAKLGLN